MRVESCLFTVVNNTMIMFLGLLVLGKMLKANLRTQGQSYI